MASPTILGVWEPLICIHCVVAEFKIATFSRIQRNIVNLTNVCHLLFSVPNIFSKPGRSHHRNNVINLNWKADCTISMLLAIIKDIIQWSWSRGTAQIFGRLLSFKSFLLFHVACLPPKVGKQNAAYDKTVSTRHVCCNQPLTKCLNKKINGWLRRKYWSSG